MTRSVGSAWLWRCSFAVWLALAPHSVHAQPFELEQHFGSGIEPCFDAAQLSAATIERLKRATPALTASAPTPTTSAAVAPPPSLRVQLLVDAQGDRWLASFASENRTTGEHGVREIVVAPSCTGLLDASSLVLALIVEQAGVSVSAAPSPPAVQGPAPTTPPPPPPPPPRAASVPARRAPALPADLARSVPVALGLAAGMGSGLAPRVAPMLELSLQVPLTARPSANTVLPLFVELDLDAFLPRATAAAPPHPPADEGDFNPFMPAGNTNPAAPASLASERGVIGGAGAHARLCARLDYGPLSLDPCLGTWLRILRAVPAPEVMDLIGRTYSLTGWDARLRLGLRVSSSWSVQLSGAVLVPFKLQTMRLAMAPTEVSEFGNAPRLIGEPLPSSFVYRVSYLESELLLGVALAL